MPVFALIDANNFYVSCQQVFQPYLKGRPVIVLSNNDGCVVSRSQEAKDLGIPMGIPFFKIKSLVHQNNVVTFSSNFSLYGAMSRRVMEVLGGFTPRLEYYSVDEAFLDLSGFDTRNLKQYGQDMRGRVLQWTGIPVSVGIAETKTLAKLAATLAKKNQAKTGGVVDLSYSRHQNLALSRTPVEDVWGVGHRLAVKLKAAKITTALDLKQADDAWILRRFSVVLMRTVNELRGISCIPIQTGKARSKTIMTSRSFSGLIEHSPTLQQAVATFAARSAEKMRQEELAATQLMVFIATHPHRHDEPAYNNARTLKLPAQTECTDEIIHYALEALTDIYQDGYRYYRAGVRLEELVPASEAQHSLFDTLQGIDRERRGTLMKMLDSLNRRFGSGTVHYAAEGTFGS